MGRTFFFNGILISVATGDLTLVLEDEIISLLNKRAIRIVPAEESPSGFYSRYILIPKKGAAYVRS